MKALHHVQELLSVGNMDYGSHLRAAQESVKAAEFQLRRALEHDTPQERAKAAKDLHAAHVDIEKILANSVTKTPPGTIKPGNEAAKRAVTHRELTEAIHIIENAHHLLMAVDHEIKDYEHEKRELLKKRDEIKKKVREEFHTKIENLSKEIHQENQQKKELEQKKGTSQAKTQGRLPGTDRGIGEPAQGTGQEEITLAPLRVRPRAAQNDSEVGPMNELACPTNERLRAMIDGKLSSALTASFSQHLKACPSCARVVARLRGRSTSSLRGSLRGTSIM